VHFVSGSAAARHGVSRRYIIVRDDTFAQKRLSRECYKRRNDSGRSSCQLFHAHDEWSLREQVSRGLTGEGCVIWTFRAS